MITGITIENFKGVRDRITLDLGPITLLFGANSAGKSTILHALHYAREIFERGNLNADQTVSGGESIDLGGFKNCLNHEAGLQPLILGFSVKNNEAPWPNFKFAQYADGEFIVEESIFSRPETFSLQVEIVWSDLENAPFIRLLEINFDNIPIARLRHEPGHPYAEASLNVRHPCLTLFEQHDHLVNAFGYLFTDYDPGDITALEVLIGAATEKPKIFVPHQEVWHSWQTEGPINKLDWVSSSIASHDGNEVFGEYLDNLVCDAIYQIFISPLKRIEQELKAFRYVGPIRTLPSRSFTPPRFRDIRRWANGLAAWDELYSGDDELIERVSRWLADPECLNTGYRVERKQVIELDLANPLVRRIYDGRAFDEVDQDQPFSLHQFPLRQRVSLLDSAGTELQPADVGIGISQVLPVLVASLLPDASFIAFEQPELHLHPRVQAALADLFIEGIASKERQFLIETHSEHLILRLLRRIRETEVRKAPSGRQLRTDDLAIYYLKSEEGATTAQRIDVDVKGEFIQPWPDDFFDIDFYERFTTGENG